MDRKNADEHIRNHVKYPATAEDIKQACNRMSDFSTEDGHWMNGHLPDGRYETPEAVVRAFGW
ncbi:MAG TPA: hypothetical protein VMH22_05550 [bacterium]|nr:hypothetical protein [bacterium]